MIIKKPDWTLIREGEEQGHMVSMTGTIEPKRTPLNDELSTYFRNELPRYQGSFGEEDGESILYALNEYMTENKIDKYALDFPLTSGTDVHLIPVTENLSLKLIVADEYHGDGDYSKYVMADFFLINEQTTTEDVDALVQFVKTYILGAV